MQVKFLKNVVENIAGKSATEIVDLLLGKKDVNEFLIAKKLKLTINQTRNILYKLSDSCIVSFTRKKDKRKGWYIYFWTLNNLKSLELLEKNLLDELSMLENQLRSRKTRRFYFCKTCNVEIGEETALLNQFTCSECGEVYSLSESTGVIREIEGKIAKLQKNIEIIGREKDSEMGKKEKELKRKASREKRKELSRRKSKKTKLTMAKLKEKKLTKAKSKKTKSPKKEQTKKKKIRKKPRAKSIKKKKRD